MPQAFKEMHYDVVVVGGGSAGIAAATSAARNGADTLLVESGPMVGGDLISGLPIDGCLNSRGEWIVGGYLTELLDECKKLDGFTGAFSDWRTLWVVCIDPQVINIAIVKLLERHGVSLLLYTFAEDVILEGGKIRGVMVVNKHGRSMLRAKSFVDCTGDGDIAAWAGAPYEMGGEQGELQPVSMVFRMSNVDTERLLAFVRDHPENVSLAESPFITKSKEQCAVELYRQGYPKVFLVAEGPLLGEAIKKEEIYPCSMLAITPVSIPRREVSINSTRIAGINAVNTPQLSSSLTELMNQVLICSSFLKKKVPGFEDSSLSGLAPKIGVRETRRIMGDYVLTDEDVLQGRKTEEGIAKGGHEYDIHGSGTDHIRTHISDGGSYDIPFGCLVPRELDNVLIAGRCLSSTRGAHSTARVMGTCMATGQAAGTAAAMCVPDNLKTREIRIRELRARLKEQGAVLDGTY